LSPITSKGKASTIRLLPTHLLNLPLTQNKYT
jgi:hypothetical protein